MVDTWSFDAANKKPTKVEDPSPPPTYPKPTIGRVVHYVSQVSDTDTAAIIAEVLGNNACHLFVMDPSFGSANFKYSVRWSEHGERGTWHWPERV